LKLETSADVLIGYTNQGVNLILLVDYTNQGKYFFRPNKITFPLNIDYQSVD